MTSNKINKKFQNKILVRKVINTVQAEWHSLNTEIAEK